MTDQALKAAVEQLTSAANEFDWREGDTVVVHALDLRTLLAALSSQASVMEEKRAKLRNVVAHATGGSVLNGEELGLNDICCRITAFRNRIYLDGQEKARTLGDRHDD